MSFANSIRKKPIDRVRDIMVDEATRIEQFHGEAKEFDHGGLRWRYIGKRLYECRPTGANGYITMTGVNVEAEYDINMEGFRIARMDFKMTTAAGLDFGGATNIQVALVQPFSNMEVDLVNEAVAGHSASYELGESYEYIPRRIVCTLNGPATNLVYPILTMQLMR